MNLLVPFSSSLRLRFLLAILLWTAMGIMGIWYTATRVFADHVEQSYHEELEVHVRELARLSTLGADGAPMLQRPLSDPRYEEPLSGFYWQVSVRNRPRLLSESMTRGQLDDRVAHSPDIAHVIEAGPTGPAITYGMIKQGPNGEEMHIIIATDKSELDEDIAAFTVELSVWLATLGGLLLATGFVVIIYGLRPLDRLGTAINRLRGGEAERLEGRYPAEIAPLVNDLNDYVGQTTQLVERARVQAGNLAHSLRTPLAVVTDEAERLAQRPDCASSAQVLLDQTERMQQQIDYQLARARSAAAARTPGSRSVLPGLLVPVISAMERLHPDKTFVLEMPAQDVTLPLDPVNLAELASILLDNAGKWAASEVRIALHAIDGCHVLTIRDDGPGMSAGQIARAFEIGTRFDPATPGSGLGLAMARDIAEALGVQIELAGTDPGLLVTVTLPERPHEV